MRKTANILWLGIKELRSFSRDVFLVGFVVWSFSLAILSQSQGHLQEVYNASIGIVDEDHSTLSRQIAQAFLPPQFKAPIQIADGDVDRLMDTGRLTFALDIPPHLERDLLGGRQPKLQLIVDATAMTQAGIGSGYAQQMISDTIARYLSHAEPPTPAGVTVNVRVAFNPNSDPAWFVGVMGIINNINILAIMLAGAAIVREREHGTMDHLLVMPLTPFEIAVSKVWANGLVITAAVAFSLYVVVEALIKVPIAGSIPLFLCGVVLYLFFTTAIGVFLGTVARSMPQLGLLLILVALPMNMLSGANTPIDSMPTVLRNIMQVSPSTHFVSIAQAILYRGAGIDVVWPHFVNVVFCGALFLALAVLRFRSVVMQSN